MVVPTATSLASKKANKRRKLVQTPEEQATVAVRYTVRVLRPAVVSYFEVAPRGHCRLLEPIPLPTGETGDWLNSNCPGSG